MDRSTFLTLLDELLELPPGSLKGPERVEDLEQWDSLAMVSFIALANQHFEVAVSPRLFANCNTVDDLLGLIEPLSTSA